MKLKINNFDWLKIISVNKEIYFKELQLTPSGNDKVTVFKRNQIIIFAR